MKTLLNVLVTERQCSKFLRFLKIEKQENNVSEQRTLSGADRD